MPAQYSLVPIGTVRSPIREAVDDVWGGVVSRIELDATRFHSDCLAGLDQFSHVEILFLVDRVEDSEINFGPRQPCGRTDWPAVGIFAQRGKGRPNRLGSTVCRMVSVKDLCLEVEPAWATELMSGNRRKS